MIGFKKNFGMCGESCPSAGKTKSGLDYIFSAPGGLEKAEMARMSYRERIIQIVTTHSQGKKAILNPGNVEFLDQVLTDETKRLIENTTLDYDIFAQILKDGLDANDRGEDINEYLKDRLGA